MKLKVFVATIGLLGIGIASSPVLAAHATKHKMKHQTTATADYKDYKDAGSLPVCTISQDTMILTSATQNMGRSLPNPCNPGWFNRIQFSGGVNVDLGKFGNRNSDYFGENYQRFSLNDAYLNIAANVNDWTKAFASLSYNTATINNPDLTVAKLAGLDTTSGNAEYDAAYSNNVTSGSSSTVQLEQAFATFGNFDVSPFYLQVGKQFQDFSRYDLHPITESLTQVLSEVLTTSAKVGFVASGFNGSIFAFDDPLAKVGQSQKTTNYGASLGYAAPSDQLGWDIGVGYLYNLIGANDVAYRVNQFETNEAVVLGSGGQGYRTRVSAAALYADVNSGPFSLSARYTTALEKFNALDLPKDLGALNNVVAGTGGTGAEPWAAGITAGYGFEGWGKNQNVYLGYQASNQAVYMSLPKSRWLLGYGIDMFGKNTQLGVEWDHDNAYSSGNGGNGNNSNLVSIRSSVQFG